MNQSTAWPVYFQPQTGAASASEPRALVPSHVLDIFTLRDPVSRQAERVVIAGCLGGAILIVTERDFGSLDGDMRGQIQSAEISARNQFRTIVAADLSIATLDAIEQRVQARGLNDAVFLYGTLYARLTFASGRLQVVPCLYNGHFTSGRLDVLQGCRLGALHAFHSPLVEGEQIGHVLLPAAPLETIRQGQGLALLYPFLDPLKIQSADNTFILLRIMYDLLTRLQADMRHEGVRHVFTQATIFVPSRRQLESELAADGYQVDGDTAFRQSASTASGDATTLLGRLRSLTREWTAPRIALPPQATLEDYEKLIAEVLPTIASQADAAMLQAVAGSIGGPTAPMNNVPPSSAGVPTTPLTPVVAPAPTAARVSRRDWSNDFAAGMPPAPQPAPQPQVAWWQAARNPSETGETDLVSRDDWLRDFLAVSHVQASKNAPQPKARSEGPDWSNDFSPGSPKPAAPPAQDWADDFGSGE